MTPWEEVIGIRPSNGSLAEYGITYRQVDLLPDGSFDWEGIEKALNDKTRMVTIPAGPKVMRQDQRYL